jgi:hypothetical protein
LRCPQGLYGGVCGWRDFAGKPRLSLTSSAALAFALHCYWAAAELVAVASCCLQSQIQNHQNRTCFLLLLLSYVMCSMINVENI